MINIHDLPQKAEILEMNDVEISQITGGADDWLVNSAAQLGQASEEHLQNMSDIGAQMGKVDSESNPEEFARLNSEFSSEAQTFKMYQEAINTSIKSVGEGMSSVARKS